MIIVNGKKLDKLQFPDRSYLIRSNEESGEVTIKFLYESDEEVFHLFCLAKHIKNRTKASLILEMPYLPNARMDRVKNADEVFTLKYFCELINALHFDRVEVLDAHSNVGIGLLDRAINRSPKKYIDKVLEIIADENIVLFFPDEGACKRYMEIMGEVPFCFAIKKRDWRSGIIQGLDVIKNGLEIEGKTVLMIDDICSYGGTFYYSAEELKRAGVKEIYSYSTHTENSILSEKSKYYSLLESGEVRKHFTTESIFTGKSKHISVLS